MYSYTPHALAQLKETPKKESTLDVDDQKIFIDSILRFLPGKRLVFKGTVNNQNVVVKCFMGKSATRHIKRELSGLENFVEAGINTPKIIDTQQYTNFAILTTEFLDDSQSLEAVWQSSINDQQRLNLLKQIMRIVGQLHQLNILHHDPHLDNFLIVDQTLFLIDGGGVCKEKTPISRALALDNLAFFLSVLFPKYDHFSFQCLNAYQQIFPLDDVDKHGLLEAIWARRKWRRRFLEKIFRTCTDFVAESSFRKFQVVSRSECCKSLTEFLTAPDAYINTGHVLKRGSTNTVSIVSLTNGKKVFVKRYKSNKGLIHQFFRGFRASRARNSWYIGHYFLRLLGIDTPKPIALIEKKIGIFVTCSYLVTEFVKGETALHYFDNLTEINSTAIQRADALVEILSTLKQGLVFHGDMKATNFIFTDTRNLVIDLDQTIILNKDKHPEKFIKKDRERFNRNWSENSIAADLFGSRLQSK